MEYASQPTPEQHIKSLRLEAQVLASALEFEAAHACFRQAHAVAERHELDKPQVLVLVDLAMFHQLRGRLCDAVDAGEKATQLASDLGYVSGRLFALNNLASAQHMRGAYAPAIDLLEEGLALGRRHGHTRIETLSLLGQADLLSDLRELDAGIRVAQRALSLALVSDEHELVAQGLRALSVLHRVGGDLALARGTLDEASRLPKTPDYVTASIEIESGALCIREGNPRLGMSVLERTVNRLEATQSRVELARAVLHLAHARFAVLGIKAAVRDLDRLVELVRSMQQAHFLVPVAARMPRLWAAASGIGRTDLRELLARPDLRPTASAVVRDLPPSARFDDPHPKYLTAREREIVLGLCEGLSRDEISTRVGRSRSTIDKAISGLYASTGFRAAYQIVAWAHRCGVFDPLRQADEPVRTVGG